MGKILTPIETALTFFGLFQVGFDLLTATDAQTIFNAKISSLREAVEWSYKYLKLIFSRNDFPGA